MLPESGSFTPCPVAVHHAELWPVSRPCHAFENLYLHLATVKPWVTVSRREVSPGCFQCIESSPSPFEPVVGGWAKLGLAFGLCESQSACGWCRFGVSRHRWEHDLPSPIRKGTIALLPRRTAFGRLHPSQVRSVPVPPKQPSVAPGVLTPLPWAKP